MAEGKRSRRRFLTDLVYLGGGTLAASLLMYRVSGGAPPKGQIPFAAFPQIRKNAHLWSNAQTFVGQAVEDFGTKAGWSETTAYRVRSDWDGNQFGPKLASFLNSDVSTRATALVIGAWFNEDPSQTSDVAISALVKNKERLAQLRALYLGDIMSEESEMSWIQQSDISPLLEAFPQLEVLRVRGSAGLSISRPAHKNLRALAIESGGLDKSVVQAIGRAEFPNLEYLELWLGTEDYGGGVTEEDLAPILSGKVFPKLRYLGLRNYDKIDAIIPAIIKSRAIGSLEELDLSLGILTDAGGEALLKLAGSSLRRLNLHHHYMSPGLVTGMEDSFTLELDVSNPEHMSTDPEDRYVAVGE